MKNLYAPWRSPYSESLNAVQDKTQSCVFCIVDQEKDDRTNFILKRYDHCYIVLNKYPYNAGHLMVIPYAHVKDLHSLPVIARHEVIESVSLCTQILQKELACQGINVGLNIGAAAGAGIPNHLHAHVLPRWNGDTNFLPTLAGAKVISFDLLEMYQKLKPVFV